MPSLLDSPPSGLGPTSELPPDTTISQLDLTQTATQAEPSGDTNMQPEQTAPEEQDSPDESPLDPRVFGPGGPPAPAAQSMNLMQTRQRIPNAAPAAPANGQQQSGGESSDGGVMLAHSSRIARPTPPTSAPRLNDLRAKAPAAPQRQTRIVEWRSTLQPPSGDETSDFDALATGTRRPRAMTLGSSRRPQLGERPANLFPPRQTAQQQTSSGEESSDSQRLTMKDTGSRAPPRPANTSHPRSANMSHPRPANTSQTRPAPASQPQSRPWPTYRTPSDVLVEVGQPPSNTSIGNRPRRRTLHAPAVRGRQPSRPQHHFSSNVASGETSPGAVGAQTTRDNSENRRPAQLGYFDFSIPPTSTLPPLTGTSPAPPPTPNETVAPRIHSMQDYVLEMAECPPDIYLPAQQLGHPPPQPFQQHARVFRPPRRRRRDPTLNPRAANTPSRFAGDDGYFEYAGFYAHAQPRRLLLPRVRASRAAAVEAHE